MNKLQQNLYQLLEEIDEICKKHDIQYFLAGGTALGTVRNHCFLPWDDDIDLYITRDNWNKLKSVLQEEKVQLLEERSFAHIDNTEYYCNPIPRYIDNSTTAIYKSQALPGKACGQHIEMLIMDPLPVDEKAREEYIKLLKVYTELVSPYFVVNKNLSIEQFEEHYQLYNKYYWKSKIWGQQRVIKELEKMFQQYSEEECEDYCMRWGIDILIYRKEHFGNGRLERFEKHDFPVGENAEGIFRVAYGDSWMYVPEHEEQVVHNALQDLDIPFREYTENYIPKVDRKKVFKAYKKNKRSNMKVFIHRRKLEKNIAESKCTIFANISLPQLEKRISELRDMLQRKDYTSLTEVLSEYYSIQLNRMTRKYKVYIPISDELLSIAMRNYIEQGKYFTANNLLKMRQLLEIPLSEELREIEALILACRELSIARYDLKDYEKTEQLLAEYEQAYPEQLDVYRTRIWIQENRQDWSGIISRAEEALEKYPFDGEIKAYLAQAYAQQGNNDKAITLYREAVYQTRNGLIWEKVKNEAGISRIDEEARDE